LRKAADAIADVLANDKDDDVRATAAWALGSMNLGKAPPALVKAIRDEDDDVRLRAAWALGQIGDADAVPQVVAALRVETVDRIRQAQVRALLESGERSETVFKELLESKDAKTRELAVRALAGKRSPSPWPWPWPRPRPSP
jgi:HEAT repeat protein